MAGRHIQEVIEEAVVARHAAEFWSLRRLMKETQRCEHPLPCCAARDVATFDADGIGGKRESHGRDA